MAATFATNEEGMTKRYRCRNSIRFSTWASNNASIEEICMSLNHNKEEWVRIFYLYWYLTIQGYLRRKFVQKFQRKGEKLSKFPELSFVRHFQMDSPPFQYSNFFRNFAKKLTFNDMLKIEKNELFRPNIPNGIKIWKKTESSCFRVSPLQWLFWDILYNRFQFRLLWK